MAKRDAESFRTHAGMWDFCLVAVGIAGASVAKKSTATDGKYRAIRKMPARWPIPTCRRRAMRSCVMRSVRLQIAVSQRWDKRTTPESIWISLSVASRCVRPNAHSFTNRGMVSLARLSFESYVTALHEIYQSQLPLYVSIDALLHAVYASNDGLMADLEERIAVPNIIKFLTETRAKLPSFQQAISADTAHDLDPVFDGSGAVLGTNIRRFFRRQKTKRAVCLPRFDRPKI